ncbi:MAG: response regulator [Planctomycetaceae bacterium]
MELQPARILVVDDDVDTCRNLADILSDIGYQVDVAHDGRVALRMVRDKPYDIALLDLKMPGMDGVTLYREIRKLRADTVAMIVTAYATNEAATEALEAGAWQVLPKPIDLSRLLPLVEEASGQPLVLVVDDDHDLCENLWNILRERGFRVCVAHDRTEAAERLQDQTFEVVLIDMKLPGGDGGEIYRLIRQHAPDTRAVVITGHQKELGDMVQQILDEGADAVCYKPFDVPELLEVVGRLSQHRG